MFTFPQKNIQGVAKPRSVNQTDDIERAQHKKGVVDFVDPTKVVYQLGVKEGMHVVDLGAGSGAYTKVMANFVGAVGQVYAVEVQKDLLQRLKTDMQKLGYNHITYIWGNIEKIGGTKIGDAEIDFVLISNVLFQVEDVEQCLQEAFRILKKGGGVGVVEWSDSSNGMGPRPDALIARGTLLAKLHEAGFAYSKDFDAGSHHYGCLALKPKL
ncbi:MAG: methyltransferase domain-containing protein [Minisyncoccia bacterium]